MQLENTFTVPTGIDDAWAAFNDPTRFAPCFPGAVVESYEGDSFAGTVRVKLGPISLTYQGTGTYLRRDAAGYAVLIDATGREARGSGTANATVNGWLTALGADHTQVKMITDLTVTGRPAQFGRGLMTEVSEEIISRFAACLATRLGPAATAAAAGSAAGAGSGGEASGLAVIGPVGATGPVGPGPVDTSGSGSVGAYGAGSAGAGVPAVAVSTNGVGPRPAADEVGPIDLADEVEPIDLIGDGGVPVLKRAAPAFLALVLLFVVIRRIKNR